MAALPKYNAHDILVMSEEEVFNIPDVVIEVVFSDGSLITTRQRTAWSWLLWDMLRGHPNTPILMEFHIGNEVLTPMTHAGVLGRIKAMCSHLYPDPNELYHVIHYSFNNMYNVLTTRLEEYVSSTSALDILAVLEQPRIKELNDAIMNNPTVTAPMIDKAHEEIEHILLHDPSLLTNPVAISVKNDLVKARQMVQCVSARGFMSEVNDQNFRTPMLTSYSQGMRTLSAYAMDSRTASIAALSQESTMRTFQYQNRSFQILNSDIVNIHSGDCGTTSTTEIFIDTSEKLRQYIGIYYLNDNDVWEVIDTKNRKLLNRPLRIRSLVDCIHPDRHGFCEKCFGTLASSMVYGDKVGQLISAHVQSKLSQGALSVKHYSSNSKDSVYHLSIDAKQYFAKHPTKHTLIMVNPLLVKNNGVILFDPEEVRNINNLDNHDSINSVSIGRYTKVSQVMVQYTEGDTLVSQVIDIENSTKYASLTTDALKYLLEHKWSVDDNGFYRVSMSDWDVNKPFMQIPRKKADMVKAGKQFDDFLKGVSSKGRSDNNSIVAFSNFGDAMMAFQELTIEHIPMRVSHMQVMLYGLLAADPVNEDYRLPDPLNRKSGVFVSFRDKLNNGNIAVAMAYERQGGILMNPSSFINHKRSFSDFEYFIMGGEKLK